MKTIPLLLACFCFSFVVCGYDVHTKALVPVTFEETPVHTPLRLVENGVLRFAIVADLKHEAEVKSNSPKCLESAIAVLAEAFEKCTGKRPVVLDISDQKKAMEYPFRLVVGDNDLVRANGIFTEHLPMQGFAVRTFAGGVILAGRDSSLIENWNADPLDKFGVSPGKRYAAYDFV